MLFVKKLPWASLLLLVFTYGVFGWLIAADTRKLGLTSLPNIPWWLWLMGSAYSLLIALALTAPLAVIRSFFGSWLQSDTRAFISVVVGAFVAVVLLCWLEVVIRILVLLSAAALVRLDLQTAGYGEWQAFGILAIASITGFGLGVVALQLL
jgi:hypothetical protein